MKSEKSGWLGTKQSSVLAGPVPAEHTERLLERVG